MTHRANFDGTGQERALRGLLHWQRGVGLVTAEGKTLRDLERELGVSQHTLNRYLSGRTAISLANLPAFAAAFCVSPEDLAMAMLDEPEDVLGPFDFEAELARVLPDSPRRRARIRERAKGTSQRVQRILIASLEEVVSGQRPPPPLQTVPA